MPLKVRHRGNVDENILSSLGKEPFAPHLNLDGLGGVLHHLDHHHLAETTSKSHHPFDAVDDQASQDEGPGLVVCEWRRCVEGGGEEGGI